MEAKFELDAFNAARGRLLAEGIDVSGTGDIKFSDDGLRRYSSGPWAVGFGFYCGGFA